MEYWEKEILDDLFALRNMLYFLTLKFSGFTASFYIVTFLLPQQTVGTCCNRKCLNVARFDFKDIS